MATNYDWSTYGMVNDDETGTWQTEPTTSLVNDTDWSTYGMNPSPTTGSTGGSWQTEPYVGEGETDWSEYGTYPSPTGSNTPVATTPEQQLSSGNAPTGAVKVVNGSWVDALGQILAPFTPYVNAAINGAITPYLSNFLSNGMLDEARDMVINAGTISTKVPLPDLSKLIPILQQQVNIGAMTPAQAEVALQQASNMNNVQSDQASIDGQRRALARLEQIANQGGMTSADRAQLTEAMNAAAAKTASDRAAQIQQMQMQGNAGTGAELAARLSGIQSGANANAAAGANIATNAQQRALTALQQNLQGNAALNTQMFEQDAAKAKAQDVINAFNATARNNMAVNNAGWQQDANRTTYNSTNDINRFNTGIANQQGMLPYLTAQQAYDNDLRRANQIGMQGVSAGTQLGKFGTDQANRSGIAAGLNIGFGQATPGNPSGIFSTNTAGNTPNSGGNTGTTNQPGTSTGTGQQPGTNQANTNTGSSTLNTINKGLNAVNTVGNVVSGVSNAWNTISGWFSDETLKTDKQELTDDDIDRFMGELTGYKYRYKGDTHNPQQFGVMAQDVEKSTPDSVVNTPAGKMIQPEPLFGKALSALANQNERIRKLEGKV